MTMAIAAPEPDLLALKKYERRNWTKPAPFRAACCRLNPCASAVLRSHEFQPAALVGGDYLDYFSHPDGMIGMYVGDVSGKGPPAAMYAALAVITVRGIHKTGQHPAQVMALLNKRLLLRGIPARYTAIQ
jgi:hypothetical protein